MSELPQPLRTTEWDKEQILDAYLQPYLQKVTKVTSHNEYGRPVYTTLIIKWIEHE
jgi:hypothetical protein